MRGVGGVDVSVPRHWWLRLDALRLSELSLGLVFLAPSLAIFALFAFYPLVKSAMLGLYVTNPFGRGDIYVGPQQYLDVLRSPGLLQELRVTAAFAVYTVCGGVLAGLLLALAANAKLKGIGVYRLLLSSPIATSVAVASLAWLQLFNPTVGVLNYLLHFIHVSPLGWITSPRYSLLSISLTTIWMHLGFDMLVLLAGLQAIPEEIYESTRVDGAGPIRTFFASPCRSYRRRCSLSSLSRRFGRLSRLVRSTC